jgi:hypothetical protein
MAYDVGSIDPNTINFWMLQKYPKDSEANLPIFLKVHQTKMEILISLQLRVSITVLHTCILFYLNVIDELFMPAYINVCNGHFNLLIIRVHHGEIEIVVSLNKPQKLYQNMIDVLKR